jgi:hypothetical protein
MPVQKRTAAPARRFVATLSVLALAALGLDAAGAATRVPFQQQVQLQCGSGVCRADFVDLADNQALDVTHVWCEFNLASGGTAFRGTVYYVPSTPYFSAPLDLLWFRLVGTQHAYTFGADPDMRVPLGKRLTVAINYAGTLHSGNCSFTGFRITV